MGAEDERREGYRRQEDVEWRVRMENNRLTLLNAMRDLRADVDETVGENQRLRKIIGGDAEEHEEGMIAQLARLEKDRNRLFAVLDPDHTGKGGLIKQHEALWDERGRRVVAEGYRWKFWTAIVVGIPALLYALMDVSERIWAMLEARNHPTKIERIIEHGKHPHVGTRYVPHYIPAASDGDQNP